MCVSSIYLITCTFYCIEEIKASVHAQTATFIIFTPCQLSYDIRVNASYVEVFWACGSIDLCVLTAYVDTHSTNLFSCIIV